MKYIFLEDFVEFQWIHLAENLILESMSHVNNPNSDLFIYSVTHFQHFYHPEFNNVIATSSLSIVLLTVIICCNVIIKTAYYKQCSQGPQRTNFFHLICIYLGNS